AIPDRGTYWHLGKEVKHAISGPTRMNEHPEVNKPEPKRRKSKGELEIVREKRRLEAAEKHRMRADGVPEIIDRTPRRDDDRRLVQHALAREEVRAQRVEDRESRAAVLRAFAEAHRAHELGARPVYAARDGRR